MIAANPALADERDFCADRPGLGTPPCTLSPGEAMAEIGVAEWDHTRDASDIEDDLTLADTVLRLGIARSAEVQLGLTVHERDRTRERGSGNVAVVAGTGDAMIALRRGIAGANGPIAIEGFVTLPVGKAQIGAGRVTGGVLLPLQLQIPAGFQFAATPEIDLHANEDGHGRHLAWGTVIGIDHPITKSIAATLEVSAFRDDDPSGHTTDARVAGSLAWQAGKRFQIDLELDCGLAIGAPDRAILVGLARRFE